MVIPPTWRVSRLCIAGRRHTAATWVEISANDASKHGYAARQIRPNFEEALKIVEDVSWRIY